MTFLDKIKLNDQKKRETKIMKTCYKKGFDLRKNFQNFSYKKSWVKKKSFGRSQKKLM